MNWLKRIGGWAIALAGYLVAYNVLYFLSIIIRAVRITMASSGSLSETISWWGTNIVATIIIALVCQYAVPFIIMLSNKVSYSEKGLRFKVVGFVALGAAVLNIIANLNTEGWSPLHALFMLVFSGVMLWKAFGLYQKN